MSQCRESRCRAGVGSCGVAGLPFCAGRVPECVRTAQRHARRVPSWPLRPPLLLESSVTTAGSWEDRVGCQSAVGKALLRGWAEAGLGLGSCLRLPAQWLQVPCL